MSKFSSFKNHQLITENWKKFLKEGSAEADLAEGVGNSEAVLKLVEKLIEAGLDMKTLLKQIALGEQASEQIINIIRGPRTRADEVEWPVDAAIGDAIAVAHQDTGPMQYEDVLDAMAELVSAPQEE